MDKSGEVVPIISKDDLLMTKSPLAPEQIQLFYQRTPEDKIMTRPAKGGGEWKYVTTSYVIETLNRVFGYLWSFEVLSSLDEVATLAPTGTCIVKGRLTVQIGDRKLVKEQFGRCDVKFRRGTKEFLDLGNDMKGAASDALKKCASEFGLFRDVYSDDEFVVARIVSGEEMEEIENEKFEEAKEAMRKAKTMDELRSVFCDLPPEIRGSKTVVASKNALKVRMAKKEKQNDGTK